MHGAIDLFLCEIHSLGSNDEFILNIVFSVNYRDNSSDKALDRRVHSEQIRVKLLTVTANNSGNISVIYRIFKDLRRFFMYVAYGTVYLYFNRFSKIFAFNYFSFFLLI